MGALQELDLIFVEKSRSQLAQAARDGRGAGDDVAALPVAFPAVEVGQLAARLLDQNGSRGDVPRREMKLEESVEDAGRDHGEIERGRPGAADRAGAQEDLSKKGQVQIDAFTIAKGKPGRDECALQRRAVIDMDVCSVAKRSRAALGCIE